MHTFGRLVVGMGILGVMNAEIVINEIHYNSRPNDARDEFVELHNTGPVAVDLSGWFFNDGFDYTFPAGSTIEAGGFVVVAQNPGALLTRYGVSSFGPFVGGLSGDGERVELRQANGVVADVVEYQDRFPWPTAAGGAGSSMELIHPGLDNDLGGSWRSSRVVVLPELTYLPEDGPGWRWRPGTSEASSPINAWTETGFVEDGTWTEQSMPIGFGGVGTQVFSPPISGMQNQYTSVFMRNDFEIAEGEVPQSLLLRYLLDDGFVVYLNGNEVLRVNMGAGQPTISESASTFGNENAWLETTINAGAAGLRVGTNVIAIHGFNAGASSNDFGVNVELIRPAPEITAEPEPSPGAPNTVFSVSAPPAIRQVNHSPNQPAAGEVVVITAKVTDPDGVGVVTLETQVVAPGAYIPAFLAKTTPALIANPTGPRTPNPAYEQGWVSQEMRDDGVAPDQVAGDGIYSAVVAGNPNRHLVRYRITVGDSGGAAVRVPYADDERLNFGYFHYDGVPAYATNQGTFSAEEITSVPVYHVLTTAADFNQAVAPTNNGDRIGANEFDARSEYNWSCTFVYEGEVFDNAGYRLRQRNARYSDSAGGKRSLKFRFNRGNYPTFRDQNGERYPEPWRFLATHKMVGSRGIQTWGLDQATNHLMWNLTGTPAPFTHWGHFRIVQGAQEFTSQTQGDYYGLLLALEEFDSRFLDSHELEKGNLYKLISGRTNGLDVQRYQAANSVNDGSDFSTIINQLRPDKSDTWLRDHVNWESWNRYHAVVDMVRHYDFRPNLGEHLKNRAYYFEPSPTNALGRLNVLPWDSDTSWGPNWNAGWDFPLNAIYGSGTAQNNEGSNVERVTRPLRESFSIDYLNTMREMRDLIWKEEQISLMIDPLAAQIDRIVAPDRVRWSDGRTVEAVVADMKKYAFDGGSWTGGTNGTNGIMASISEDSGLSGQQGRDAYLDALVADPALPGKPTITYSGDPGFPQDGLAFTSSNFSDPQGSGTFQAMEWRLAEVTSLGGGTRDLMPGGRVWSYRDDNVDLGTAWREPGYDDSAWSSGAAPLGFGGVDGLNFATTISSGIPTAYFRTTLEITDVNLLKSVTFRLLLDDAAVVYVNGQEAFRDGFNPGTVVTHNSFADFVETGNETSIDDFEVNPGLFVEGVNVIAIEVHNFALLNSDLGFEMTIDAEEVLLVPGESPSFEWTTEWESGEVTTFVPEVEVPAVSRVGLTYRARVRHQDDTGRWSNWSEPVEFVVGEPSIQPFLDYLVISKIMYHPLPPNASELAMMPGLEEGDFEWIEIMNIGPEALDLTNVRFTKGIDFDFVAGSKTSIAAGERLLVVANEAAFNLRHGHAQTPDFVVGEFSRNLSNAGELVKLSFGAGTLIREVIYGDRFPWPGAADGSGASLVRVDGFGELASDWRPSVGQNGAPAVDDGLPFTGDLASYALLGELKINLVEVGGQTYADLSVVRRVNADQASIVVQSGTNLEAWTVAGVTRISETYGPGEASRVVYRTNLPIASDADFFRLRIQLK